MMISLDVRPEVGAELIRQAAVLGSTMEIHAAHLLEAAVEGPAVSWAGLTGKSFVDECSKVRGLLTDEEVDTLFRWERSFSPVVEFK